MPDYHPYNITELLGIQYDLKSRPCRYEHFAEQTADGDCKTCLELKRLKKESYNQTMLGYK